MATKDADRLAEPLAELVRVDFTPHFGQLADKFADEPRWQGLCDAGSELWLDSGDIEAVGRLWARQLSAVTTNNTLLNKEVQKGQYDGLIRKAATLIRTRSGRRVSDRELALEIAFVLNARHALRLVEAFDACVSVEEHTDLANDADAALRYARRYQAICPQRFFVKMPLTPAGLIAARRCHDQDIPVNLTLGFSARQNYLATRFARPRFVNVFLGRLNAFVADNRLGSGQFVGEKAALASQRAVAALRRATPELATEQIAASIRSGEQIALLAGIDVMTIPTKAAEEYLAAPPGRVTGRTEQDYQVELAGGVSPAHLAIDTLWDVPEELAAACDELDRRDPNELAPADLVAVLGENGVADLLIDWTKAQVATSWAEGKVPRLANWRDGLRDRQFGLDALMNLAGLNSFVADQEAMDEKVRTVLKG